jgi:sec-independent protein translocase protein TatA
MIPLALLGPLGAWELILVLVIVVFLFGARRIPDIARGLGEGIRNFKSGLRGDEGKNGPEGNRPEGPPPS